MIRILQGCRRKKIKLQLFTAFDQYQDLQKLQEMMLGEPAFQDFQKYMWFLYTIKTIHFRVHLNQKKTKINLLHSEKTKYGLMSH